MRNITIILICLSSIMFLSCQENTTNTNESRKDDNQTEAVTSNESKINTEEQSSSVPVELTNGVWTTVNRDGSVEKRFYNNGNKGYLQFHQILKGPLYIFESTAEGPVSFEGDKYTFYPSAGVVRTTYKSSGKKLGRPYNKDARTNRWELKRNGEEVLLYEYNEKDIDHKTPSLIYHNINK